MLNKINKLFKGGGVYDWTRNLHIINLCNGNYMYLGWKYLDERDDLSYQRWNALDTKISNIEELLEKKNGGRG